MSIKWEGGNAMAMKVFLLFILLGGLLTGCDREEATEGIDEDGNGRVMLSLEGGIVADSTIVFVFRKRETTDTLITRKVIRGVTEEVQAFTVELPAGYYDLRVVANAESKHITLKPPYSQADVFLDYSNGDEPPVLACGRAIVNVGVNKVAASGLVVITPFVQLTVKNVPAGVDQIDVDLLNTAAGAYIDLNYADEMAQPSITSSVYDVKADSTYVMKMYCFPTVEKYGESSLEVRCYDVDGKLVYRGSSAPFKIISRMLISCSFEENTIARAAGGSKSVTLKWEYDERHL